MSDAALAIMAKLPAAGQAKSRLSPPLTPAQAAMLYEAMLLDTIELAARLKGVQLVIAITPPDTAAYFRRVSPPETALLPVTGADIGECLSQTLGQLLRAGYSRALALNSDGPTLPITYLRRALTELKARETDIVLGPSEDGGYYLIGLKQPHPGLFQGIAWSTDRVMGQTLNRADALGLRVTQLPRWYDVDTADDLERLQAELARLPDGMLPHTRPLLYGFRQAEHQGSRRLETT
jgi:hypothetical protein